MQILTKPPLFVCLSIPNSRAVVTNHWPPVPIKFCHHASSEISHLIMTKLTYGQELYTFIFLRHRKPELKHRGPGVGINYSSGDSYHQEILRTATLTLSLFIL